MIQKVPDNLEPDDGDLDAMAPTVGGMSVQEAVDFLWQHRVKQVLKVDSYAPPAQGLTRDERKFLMALVPALGVITDAASRAGVNRNLHYQAMQKKPAKGRAISHYQEAFENMQQVVDDLLDAETLRRGFFGVPKLVTYKGQVITYTDPKTGELVPLIECEYSDRLLERAQAARNPARYGDRLNISGDVKVEHAGKVEVEKADTELANMAGACADFYENKDSLPAAPEPMRKKAKRKK